MPAPPTRATPYTEQSASVTSVVQQFMDSYQAGFLSNQRAYANVAKAATAVKPDYLLKRAVVMAKAIQQERGTIPFGALMARCERESGFKPDVVEPKTFFSAKTNKVEWRYPYPDNSIYPNGGGKYGVGPWGITAAFDNGKLGYGLTRDQALDPVLSTRASVKTLMPTHKFIVECIPAALQDIVFYTWLLSCAHASGPGNLPLAREFILSNGKGDTAWMYRGKGQPNGKGLGGCVARAFNKYKKIIMATVGETAWMRSPVYDSAEGVRRLFIAGVASPVWEKRKEKLLRGEIKGLNSSDLVAQALQSAKSTGQGLALDAFKSQKYAYDRGQQEADKSRSEHYAGGASDGQAARDHVARSAANAARTAQKADLTNLPVPKGEIMAFDEETQTYSYHTGA
jgi:hypothetical protein